MSLAAIGALAFLGACAAAPAPAAPRDPLSDRQACGLEGFAYLVGRPESDIPRDQLPAQTRIIHEGDAVTQDYSPQRLNVVIGGDGKVASMACY
ncbi:MAG: I78 family peptidase inhibitor [Hyphomonadaceae bacterium]